MGDAVYERFVRERLIVRKMVPGGRADMLHRKAVTYVRAGAQALVIKRMINEGVLSESEEALVKRARNHKSATKPKNADAIEYKWATAFEALLGHLHLSGEEARLAELMEYAAAAVEEGKHE